MGGSMHRANSFSAISLGTRSEELSSVASQLDQQQQEEWKPTLAGARFKPAQAARLAHVFQSSLYTPTAAGGGGGAAAAGAAGGGGAAAAAGGGGGGGAAAAAAAAGAAGGGGAAAAGGGAGGGGGLTSRGSGKQQHEVDEVRGQQHQQQQQQQRHHHQHQQQRQRQPQQQQQQRDTKQQQWHYHQQQQQQQQDEHHGQQKQKQQQQQQQHQSEQHPGDMSSKGVKAYFTLLPANKQDELNGPTPVTRRGDTQAVTPVSPVTPATPAVLPSRAFCGAGRSSSDLNSNRSHICSSSSSSPSKEVGNTSAAAIEAMPGVKGSNIDLVNRSSSSSSPSKEACKASAAAIGAGGGGGGATAAAFPAGVATAASGGDGGGATAAAFPAGVATAASGGGGGGATAAAFPAGGGATAGTLRQTCATASSPAAFPATAFPAAIRPADPPTHAFSGNATTTTTATTTSSSSRGSPASTHPSVQRTATVPYSTTAATVAQSPPMSSLGRTTRRTISYIDDGYSNVAELQQGVDQVDFGQLQRLTHWWSIVDQSVEELHMEGMEMQEKLEELGQRQQLLQGLLEGLSQLGDEHNMKAAR